MDHFILIVLLTFAAARVTHLVADDLFPFGSLRDKLKASSNWFLQYVGFGMSCTWCCSIWAGGFAAGLAVWQEWWSLGGIWGFFVLWFAIAQAIVLIEGLGFALMGQDD